MNSQLLVLPSKWNGQPQQKGLLEPQRLECFMSIESLITNMVMKMLGAEEDATQQYSTRREREKKHLLFLKSRPLFDKISIASCFCFTSRE